MNIKFRGLFETNKGLLVVGIFTILLFILKVNLFFCVKLMLCTSVEQAPLTSPGSKMLLYLTTACGFVAALLLVCCWYRWKWMKAYRQFPVRIMDTKWLPRFMAGWYPKNVSLSKIFFSVVIKETKRFQAEGACVLWFARPYLFVYNEEFAKALFNEHAVVNRSGLYRVTKEIFGNGIVGREGEMWKIHRKLLNPAFYLGVLKGKITIFNKNAIGFVDQLRSFDNQPIDNLVHLLKKCSFNVMTESVLGLRLNDEKQMLKAQHFMEMLVRGTKLSFLRMPYPWLHWNSFLPFSPLGRKYLKAVREIHHFTHEIVEELQKSVTVSKGKEQYIHEETEIQKSLAEILIEQHLRDPSLTVEDVRDHLSNIIIAGFDSVSVALMWCFYLLGHHPEVQERAYKEIESVVQEGDATYDHLGKLKYLDCVIKESLRLYPPLPLYGRKADRDIQCGKYTIPKGTDVIFSPFLLHRNPYVYTNPEQFQPERFTDSSETKAWIHIPFAEGYRNCLGKKFAMIEMKVVLLHVLKRFKIATLNEIDDSELTWTMVLKPAKRIRMQFTNRVQSSQAFDL